MDLLGLLKAADMCPPTLKVPPGGPVPDVGVGLLANNHYKIIVIVSSQESQERIIIVRFFTSVA